MSYRIWHVQKRNWRIEEEGEVNENVKRDTASDVDVEVDIDEDRDGDAAVAVAIAKNADVVGGANVGLGVTK